jgi:hypothetical protein
VHRLESVARPPCASQTDQEVGLGRPDNLWESLEIGRAQGIFDDEARGRSLQLELAKHRSALVATAAVGASAFFAARRRLSTSSSTE